MPHQRMTPEQLRQWQAHCGLSNDGAYAALGVGRQTYYDWLSGKTPIKPMAALACAAVAAGLPPWGEGIKKRNGP